MRKIDDEIQALLSEHRGDIRSILKDNHRLDLLYALSSQRELLLEWYDFEPEAEVLAEVPVEDPEAVQAVDRIVIITGKAEDAEGRLK